MGRLWQHLCLSSRKLIKQTGFILIAASMLTPGTGFTREKTRTIPLDVQNLKFKIDMLDFGFWIEGEPNFEF